jgi:hypothetical protein
MVAINFDDFSDYSSWWNSDCHIRTQLTILELPSAVGTIFSSKGFDPWSAAFAIASVSTTVTVAATAS